MPHYKFLEEEFTDVQNMNTVGGHYTTESTVPTNRADVCLSQLAMAYLKKAYIAAEAHQKGGMKTKDTRNTSQLSIKERAKFFEQNTQSNFAAEQAKLNERVVYFRKWLSRQGATFIGRYGIDHRRLKDKLVQYDADLARQGGTQITVRGDSIVGSDNKPFDTEKFVTHFSGPGWAIYVLSAEGNFHVASHKVGQYHHSSLLAGQAVACAGEIKVSNGRLEYLTNKSGHYTPATYDLLHALAVLQEKGNSMTFGVGCLDARFKLDRYPTVEAFLVEEEWDNASYERDKREAAAAVQSGSSLDSYGGSASYGGGNPFGSTGY